MKLTAACCAAIACWIAGEGVGMWAPYLYGVEWIEKRYRFSHYNQTYCKQCVCVSVGLMFFLP